MRALVVVGILCAGGLAAAKPPPKVYLELASVEAAPNAPADIVVKAQAVFAQLTGAKAEILPHLDGAPDPKAQPNELRRWLEDRNIRAFQVRLKLEPFQRSLVPDDKPGHTGQILTLKLGVEMLGDAIPSLALALAGTGGSTVMAEVGPNLRPREEENALDDALKDAIGHALDDAIAKLSAPPPKIKNKMKVKKLP